MNMTNRLLTRLDEIGASLERSGHALALIGLGSVGVELERLDAWSDLDFFAIVEQGHKGRYLSNLDWLSCLCPLAYQFQNTPDGFKVLFQDGIFCEFAVFEIAELGTIPFSRGRIVWKVPGLNEDIAEPVVPLPAVRQSATEWLVGEALTNLLVGLGRFRRGEKLSASRFIQQYAVDRVLELSAVIAQEIGAPRDAFANERRFEQRFPGVAQELPCFIQGYDHSCESAQAILAFLERHFDVNQAMADTIRKLCNP
jgi:lincosamide nucleotidyltransferase B/F